MGSYRKSNFCKSVNDHEKRHILRNLISWWS